MYLCFGRLSRKFFCYPSRVVAWKTVVASTHTYVDAGGGQRLRSRICIDSSCLQESMRPAKPLFLAWIPAKLMKNQSQEYLFYYRSISVTEDLIKRLIIIHLVKKFQYLWNPAIHCCCLQSLPPSFSLDNPPPPISPLEISRSKLLKHL